MLSRGGLPLRLPAARLGKCVEGHGEHNDDADDDLQM
jgi:hypothetical protein